MFYTFNWIFRMKATNWVHFKLLFYYRIKHWLHSTCNLHAFETSTQKMRFDGTKTNKSSDQIRRPRIRKVVREKFSDLPINSPHIKKALKSEGSENKNKKLIIKRKHGAKRRNNVSRVLFFHRIISCPEKSSTQQGCWIVEKAPTHYWCRQLTEIPSASLVGLTPPKIYRIALRGKPQVPSDGASRFENVAWNSVQGWEGDNTLPG